MNIPEKTVTLRNGSSRHRASRIRLCFALAALLTAAPSLADWLVLTSGEAVETKGAWAVQGQKIVFTSTGGVYSSVRASEVNIPSSRDLTAKKLEEASRPPAVATPTPKPAPVLVLTDKDFAKEPPATGEGATAAGAPGDQAGAEAGTATAEAGGAGAAAAAPAAGSQATSARPSVVPPADSLETRIAHQMPGSPAVRITNWSARPTGEDQISIFGSVMNVGSRVTAAIEVGVTLIDSEGRRIGSADAVVASTALMPQVRADFEARFEGNPAFAEVQFTVKTVEIELGKSKEGDELDEAVEEETAAGASKATGAAKPSAVKPAPAASGDAPHATVKPKP